LADAQGVRRVSNPGVLAINGCAIEAFPPIIKAAMERKWEFIGHGFTQPQHAEGGRTKRRHSHDHGGDQEGHGQAAARWLGPGLTETWERRTCSKKRLRLRRRLGAR